MDGAGAAYVVGETWSSESAGFPVAVGPDLTFNGGNADAFVAKVRPDGTALSYCGYIGGSDYDYGEGIAVDGAGAAYVVGTTWSSESAGFPVAVGPDLTYNGGGDAFVAKVRPDGTGLAYCGYIGGAGYGQGIAVDGAGAAYVVGDTISPESDGFPVAVGPDLTYNGGDYYGDAFVAKVAPDGRELLYCGYIGGSADDWGRGIAVDGAGAAYVVGWTKSSESDGFPVAVGPDLTFNGYRDAFVAKVRPDGTALVYCGYIGGAGDDGGSGIAVDGAGAAYVVGWTWSSESAGFPVAGGPDLTYNGSQDAFVAKVGGEGPPAPSPAGPLILLLASSVPSPHPLVATAHVRNTGTAYREFTLTLRLWQDSTLLDTRTFTFSLAGGAAAVRTADFGLRPVGRYRVEATLSANGTTLAAQSREVVVADPNAARIILDHADDLKAAAHAELDDIAHIPSHALADEILEIGLDKLEDYAVGKFTDFAAPIQDAGDIPRSTSDDAIAQIRDKLGRARQYKRNLSIAVRLYVRDNGVTLPDDFDPLNPDLALITDPLLKDRIKNWLTGFLADFFDGEIISPLWVNGPHGDVDHRHDAFEDFVVQHPVTGEPPGLAGQMQHGQDRVRNVVEGDALVTLGPYNVLDHTLRYDLTLQEQENKRQQMHQLGNLLKIVTAVFVVIGVVIMLLLFVGAISSTGGLATVIAPIIWKIVKVLLTVSKILPFVTALLAVSMLFTVSAIAPHVPQYHDETLDAAEVLIEGNGTAQLRSFDVAARPGRARLVARVSGPETGRSRVLVETALYSVDGRIINIVWSPLEIEANRQAALSKDVPLAPGTYRAVTTLYAEGGVAAAEAVPFEVPGPEVEMDLRLEQSRLNPGDPVEATITLTNTSTISDVNDLTLIVESTDGVNFDAWPVSLAAGGTQQIAYTFTPTTTGAYVLRAWLGIGLNTLAQQDVAYVVGTGPAVALNTAVSDVYTPGLTVTLPLTLTNVGDAADTVTVTVQTVDRLQAGVVVYSSTLTVTVPAGGTAFAEATALPTAQPGLYAAWLAVNGEAYDTRDFAVSATDTLFGLLGVGDLYLSVGQSVPVTATVRSADDTPTDATITVTVQSPAGSLASLPMNRVSTGTYRADYTPSISGTYSLELAVARVDYRGVGDQSFLVAGTPTLLIPTVTGQPKAGEIRPLTVTVHSEAGIPVPGATVVLSGTEEILRGETDEAGRVLLQTFPPDGRSYVLTTDKMGYAGATTKIAVEPLRVYLPLVLRNY